jgi:hypothetical protein
MRYSTYLWGFLFSLSTSLLCADVETVNPCPECPDPINAYEESGESENLGYAADLPADTYSDYCWYATDPETDCEYAREHNLWGIWLPEAPPLFRPFIADPRQVTYSVGWRWNDQVLEKNVIPVSFGDIFPIFRWCDIWYPRGDLEFGIEGAVWAVFDPLHESSPLIDADYYVGFPISYSFGTWAFRLRGYHISTHIGDEFLLNHPHFDRRNPSIEAFDFYVSNQFTRDIRLYGGIGWLACQDDSFRVGEFYFEAGVELRLMELGYRDYCNRLYGVPFFAMDFYYQSHFKHHINSTYAIGYEWGKVSGLRRRFRIFLEYHDGYSVEGQFSKHPTNYLSIRGTYGF